MSKTQLGGRCAISLDDGIKLPARETICTEVSTRTSEHHERLQFTLMLCCKIRSKRVHLLTLYPGIAVDVPRLTKETL